MPEASTTIAKAEKSAQNEQSCCSSQQKRRSFFAPVVQPKLTVNQPNDAYEQEADSMADSIMREPAPQSFFTPASDGIQRVKHSIQCKCDHCQEEEKKEKLQRKPIVQAKSDAAPTVSDSLASSIESTRGNGSPMDKSTQSFMENRLGSDFSSVNIHTGGQAAKMSSEINAKAFTTGNDIYFNQGQYQPQSSSGKHLLAHELTHV
ncbi:MAG: DUF4157 domain-containing protein, partial [Chitinophagaceae bacterium]